MSVAISAGKNSGSSRDGRAVTKQLPAGRLGSKALSRLTGRARGALPPPQPAAPHGSALGLQLQRAAAVAAAWLAEYLVEHATHVGLLFALAAWVAGARLLRDSS